MNTRRLLIPLLLAAPCAAWAYEAAGYVPVNPAPAAEAAPAPENDTWADRRHGAVRSRLKSWAHSMDDWFGEPDPDNPADANLRVMLDTEWNKYDNFSVKPRIRGRVKLPVLQKRLNVVFGDDSLDNEPRSNVHLYEGNARPEEKTFDKTQSRESNSSLALRWSDISKRTGIDTDADIGIRSGDDIYLRLKGSKNWQLGGDFSTRLEILFKDIQVHHFEQNMVRIVESALRQTTNQRNLATLKVGATLRTSAGTSTFVTTASRAAIARTITTTNPFAGLAVEGVFQFMKLHLLSPSKWFGIPTGGLSHHACSGHRPWSAVS